MAKFCKHCGKELEEGMTCTCVASTIPEETTTVTANTDVKAYAKGFWSLFKSFVKNPVTTGAQFVNSCNIKSALMIIGIQSVLVALLVISLVGKINSVFKDALSLAGSFSDYLSLSGILFSLPTVFILTAISTFAIACLMALVLMLFVKLFKGNTTYQYMLCLSSINSLTLLPFIACGLLLSIIMPLNINLSSLSNLGSFISPLILPVAIASLGITLGNYIMLNIIHAGSDSNKEVLPYVLFLTGIVMSVAFLLVCKIVMPMCLPSLFKEGLSSLGSLEDLLDSLF